MECRPVPGEAPIEQEVCGSALCVACAPGNLRARHGQIPRRRGTEYRCRLLRMGARRPSGRPGARWLRVDRKPLSTERPGPTRVTPTRPGRNVPSPERDPWAWLPVVVRSRHTTLDPAALRTTARKFPDRTSGGGPGRTYPSSAATCQPPPDLRIFPQRPGRRGGAAGRAARRRVVVGSALSREITPPAVRKPFARPPRSADRRAGRRRDSGRAGRGCRNEGR